MSRTYEPIATTTLGSASASVTFNSIPGTYTDLVVVISAQLTAAAGTLYFQLNSDTGSNYSYTYLLGNGTAASSARGSNQTAAYLGGTVSANIFNSIVNIFNYSNTTTNKTLISRTNSAGSATSAWVSLWRNTNAITSILIDEDSGSTFVAGSTFTLYGIKAE